VGLTLVNVVVIVVCCCSGSHFLLVAHVTHTPHWPIQPFGMSAQREKQRNVYACVCFLVCVCIGVRTVVHKTIAFKLHAVV